MSLPEERIPFPVEARYSVRPSMRRWGPDDHGHLRLDARYPEYLDAKLRLLRSDPDGCRVLAPDVDRAALRDALLRVAEGLASDAAPGRAHGRAQGRTQGAPVPGERGTPPDAAPLDAAPLDAAPLDAAPLDAPLLDAAPPDGPAPILLEAEAVRFPLLGIALEGPGLDLVRRDPVASADALPQALRARARQHLAGLEPLERLADALALAVQEDLVVMAGGAPHYVAPGDASPGDAAPKDAAPGAPVPGPVALEARVPDQRVPDQRVPEDGRSDLLHVCFPSSWDPATRAGAGFIALHAPVPHNGSLCSAAGRVVRAMVTKGPFVRYVWSLAPDDALDRNPRRLATRPPPTDPARLWFRVERQTVMPLAASGRALFTIRVYRAPLPSVLTTPERSRTLASALRSMDAALLAYKGVGGLREALLAYLDGPSGA